MSVPDDDFDPEYDTVEEDFHVTPLISLPALSPTPAVYPGCCVALSPLLLSNLSTILPSSSSLILSIGSGTGFLEALLRSEPHDINIIGVEVHPSINRYLQTNHHRVVAGSYSLEPLAIEAETWLFIYPRRVGLVQSYISTYGQGVINQIVWIGPTADWEDYKQCFEVHWDLKVQSAGELGGRGWELVAVASKKPA
ncbi:unnamed protein product [Periconia digitata]|uniref:Methyltransferase domain-containing protein n=1 Tax=Periconia digitata TaxID=1303443 RepID=A0A9W4XSD1_9PLEO|nr:unnamed protein product [Periconia digitata]